MKHIVKQAEPTGLDYARKHHLTWDEFHEQCHDSYMACRTQANEEQSGECAYTGMPLNENANIHIDHFMKKSIYPKLTFIWTNLFAAIKDNNYGADYKDEYIKRSNAENVYSKLLHPALDNPESYFWYSTNGKIDPKDGLSDEEKDRAKTTIDVFHLNDSILLNRRRELFKILQAYTDIPMEEALLYLKEYGFSFVITSFYQYNS